MRISSRWASSRRASHSSGRPKISGERYGVLLFVNCLGTGLNACLVYLFYRRHLPDGKAWVLSLIYAALVVHAATLYHAYNLCYLLAFGFFMGAMLLADSYLTAPSGARLAGMGMCALLALLSHSFAIMTLPAILLYGLLLKGETNGRFWPLVLVIGLVFAVFGAGYAHFAGIAAALRGKDTGIAVSACSLGGGVNASNIKKCLGLLREAGYDDAMIGRVKKAVGKRPEPARHEGAAEVPKEQPRGGVSAQETVVAAGILALLPCISPFAIMQKVRGVTVGNIHGEVTADAMEHYATAITARS